MTTSIVVLLAILVIAAVMFCFDWYPAEVVSLGVLLSLVLGGIVKPSVAFAGFGSDTVIMIAGLLVMSSALFQTGIVETTGKAIIDLVGERQSLLLPVIVLSVASLSAFISNTAATAFFLPVVLGLTSQSKLPASKYLLSLAFASILTSSVTLISSSTNIVVSEMLARYQQPPMGMFELAPVGIVISIVGIIYLLTLGPKLLPANDQQGSTEIDFGLRPYLSDLVILPQSPLVGKSIAELNSAYKLELNVIRVVRAGSYMMPRASTTLAVGDTLLVEGSREKLLKIKSIDGIELKADVKLLDPAVDPKDLMLAEGVILPPSRLIGKSLKATNFRDRYNVQVLAVNRTQPSGPQKLSVAKLHSGDVLLLQGLAHDLQFMDDMNLIRLIGAVSKNSIKSHRAPLAVAIFVVSLLAASTGITSFAVATLAGAFCMLATNCIAPEEAYRRMDWSVLILIGSMLAVGAAMEETGAGKLLATSLIELMGTPTPFLVISLFFIMTVILTQAMSNQAAAIVIVPIAAQTAMQLGYNVRALVMTIALAASCSYLTPLEPSCLMVYGPGNYKFRDFFVVGLPLTILIYLIVVTMVPLVWPL